MQIILELTKKFKIASVLAVHDELLKLQFVIHFYTVFHYMHKKNTDHIILHDTEEPRSVCLFIYGMWCGKTNIH